MAAKLLEGKKIADEIYSELKDQLSDLKTKGEQPKLTVVLIGNDPASEVYVRMKGRMCERLGILSETLKLNADIQQNEVLQIIDKLNKDKAVHGILVQMPLPKHLNEDLIVENILPEKDVDGFHPVNKGRLQSDLDCLKPCTPYGVLQILNRYGYSTNGKNVAVIGRSQIVGMPLSIMLSQKNELGNATVTMCHSRTKDIAFYTRNADIIVCALGVPEFLTADMVKEKAVVVDVGINRVEDNTTEKGYRLVGDVKFDELISKAEAITPVPGGVGPLTIAMLMHNTVKATKIQYDMRQ